MMLMIFPLLLALASATQQQNGSCGTCDSACQVDDLKVKSLCADSSCVQGEPVLVSADDACTIGFVAKNGQLQTMALPGCCQNATDCVKFNPDACTMHECVIAAGANAGSCVPTKLQAPECCGCDADCPARPCNTVKCVSASQSSGSQALYVHLEGKVQSHALTRLHPQEAVVTAPGSCVYTTLPAFNPAEPDVAPDCCSVSSECHNGPPNAIGICDVANLCQYVPSPPTYQCTADADCAKDEVGNKACCGRGKCFVRKCVSPGFCECKRDPDVDADGDGVPCKHDCDTRPRRALTSAIRFSARRAICRRSTRTRTACTHVARWSISCVRHGVPQRRQAGQSQPR